MEIDARGLECPQPVLRIKKTMETTDENIFSVLVSTVENLENVKRFAESQGCTVSVKQEGKEYRVDIVRGASAASSKKSKWGMQLVQPSTICCGMASYDHLTWHGGAIYCLLHQTVEKQTTSSGCASVKPERKLIEIIIKMRRTDRTLMDSKPPSIQ